MRHLQSLLACALLALAALACAWPALDKSSLFTAAGSTTADTPQQTATVSGQSLPEGWTAMPAGARSTYLGIHGGTVPVSLLVSRDGMSLVSFVGQTGNDFLELLRRADVRLPSLLTSILGSSHGGSMLLAGRAQRSMPVLYVLGDRLAAMPGVSFVRPKGAFYIMVSIPGLGTPMQAAEFLLDAGLAIVPWDEEHLRISYANSYENLSIAMDRMEKALRGRF